MIGDPGLLVVSVVVLLLVLVTGLVFGARLGRIYERNKQSCDPASRLNLAYTIREFLGLIRFQSQTGQDRWIVLSAFPDCRDGFYVEVGAADGVNGSNTKALDDLGWKGVCIDPFPTNMDGRTCEIVREVVYSEAGKTVTFDVAGGLGGIRDHLGKYRDDDRVSGARAVELITTTLNDVLRRVNAPPFIHYMSVDVEGAELAVLEGLDFAEHRIGALTIEHNCEEPKRSKIRALLERNGYRLAREWRQDDYYLLRGRSA